MKKFITNKTAKKHTILIGIGTDFTELVASHEDAFKILKQTSSIFRNSDCYEIFNNTSASANVIETLNSYLFDLQKFNKDSRCINYYINKIGDNYNVIASLDMVNFNIFHLSLDWVFLIEKRYPMMAEIIYDIIYILEERYKLCFESSSSSCPDMMFENLYERAMDNMEEKDDIRLVNKLMNHYKKYSYLIPRIYKERETNIRDIVESIKLNTSHFPKSKSVKFNALKNWIILALDFFEKHGGAYDLDYFHKISVDQFELDNGIDIEDLYDNHGPPITLHDIYSVSWFGDEYTASETVEYINIINSERGVISSFRSYFISEGGKIPFDIINSKENMFLEDLSDLILEFNYMKRFFITKQFNFLR